MNLNKYLNNKKFIIFIIKNESAIDISVKEHLFNNINILSFEKHKTLWNTNRYELCKNNQCFLVFREGELEKYISIYREIKLKHILNNVN